MIVKEYTGWLCRESETWDNKVILFHGGTKPHRPDDYGWVNGYEGNLLVEGRTQWFDADKFPDLTIENSPRKVKLKVILEDL